MTQQRITFEWVLEEGRVDFWLAPDHLNSRSALGFSSFEHRIALVILRGFVLLFVVVAAASGAGMSPGERERREAQRGISFALTLENQAWERRDRGLYESLLDPQLDREWEEAWRDYWRAGADAEPDFKATLLQVRESDGYMQATVITEQPAFEWWQTNPYREERFYRRVNRRWMRTVPPASAWGDAHTIETAHLRFIYYTRDAEAVEAVASKLETAYVAMYRTLGLASPPAEKQVITVVPAPVNRWSSTVPQLQVTSPILAQIPSSQSDAEYLAYEVMGWFTYRAIRDAAPNSDVRYLYRWPILVWGLRGWLRDDLIDQPSPWHIEAVEILRDSADTFLPIELSDITDLRTNIRPSREQVILRYLSAESFMRFIVETYGREHIPDLLRELVRRSSWSEIIPSVYGQSVEEFEAAWNAHITAAYELEEVIR